MKNLFFTLAALSLLFSCTSTSSNTESQAHDTAAKIVAPAPQELGYYTVVGDSVVIPSVEIVLDISEKAAQKLQKSKETVIVDAMFSGVPIDKNAKEAEETGQIMVAQSRKELTDARSVKFEQVKFSKKMYDALEDKDIELLINVYSGRKSTQDNLLDCGIISEKMSALKGKNYTVKCKLIVGE